MVKLNAPHDTGAVVLLAEGLTQFVILSLHLAYTVSGEVVYVGITVLQGPAAFVAHSKVVPEPQPVAEIVPIVDGQTLLTMVIVG